MVLSASGFVCSRVGRTAANSRGFDSESSVFDCFRRPLRLARVVTRGTRAACVPYAAVVREMWLPRLPTAVLGRAPLAGPPPRQHPRTLSASGPLLRLRRPHRYPIRLRSALRASPIRLSREPPRTPSSAVHSSTCDQLQPPPPPPAHLRPNRHPRPRALAAAPGHRSLNQGCVQERAPSVPHACMHCHCHVRPTEPASRPPYPAAT